MFTILPNRRSKDLSGGINRILTGLLGMLFPDKCVKCGRYISAHRPGTGESIPEALQPYFCPSCLGTGYDPFEPPFCSACGMKFHGAGLRNHPCGNCIVHPPAAGRVRAAGMYDGVMKEAVHLLKYSGRTSLARPLGTLMRDAYARYFPELCRPLLVPVPLHSAKLKSRGFNQSFLLAGHLCRNAISNEGTSGERLSMDGHSLVRSRQTPSQTVCTVEQRKQNVKDAFDVTRVDSIRGRCIVLVDDVYTTGATCSEAAGTLLAAGAASVDTLVAARAF